jgi:hypothetical protein
MLSIDSTLKVIDPGLHPDAAPVIFQTCCVKPPKGEKKGKKKKERKKGKKLEEKGPKEPRTN